MTSANSNGSYIIPSFCYSTAAQVTLTTAQFWVPGASSGTSNAAEDARSLVLPTNVTFSDLLISLQTNNNTDDGATYASRNGGSAGNLLLTFDQATGIFIDSTNSDSYIGPTVTGAAEVLFSGVYTEATSAQTVVLRGDSIRATPQN